MYAYQPLMCVCLPKCSSAIDLSFAAAVAFDLKHPRNLEMNKISFDDRRNQQRRSANSFVRLSPPPPPPPSYDETLGKWFGRQRRVHIEWRNVPRRRPKNSGRARSGGRRRSLLRKRRYFRNRICASLPKGTPLFTVRTSIAPERSTNQPTDSRTRSRCCVCVGGGLRLVLCGYSRRWIVHTPNESLNELIANDIHRETTDKLISCLTSLWVVRCCHRSPANFYKFMRNI